MRRICLLLLLTGTLTACGSTTKVATVSAPSAETDTSGPVLMAQDLQAMAYVRNAQSAIEAFYTDHGTYRGASRATLSRIEPALRGVRYELSRPSATGYTVAIESPTGTTFRLQNQGGIVSRTCSAAGAGACRAGGAW